MFQTRPFEFMTTYTAQTEWIQGRGLFICLAFFTIDLGGGMYLLSSLIGSLPGMVLAYCLVCLGTIFFISHLGRPIAAIRACLRPQTSWISRGVIFISLFLIVAFINIVTVLISTTNPIGGFNQSIPFSVNLWSLLIYAITFLMVIYAGFAMNFINGIPLWSTALLPLLYVTAGFWGGAELSSGIAALTGIETHLTITVAYILLMVLILIIPSYLISVRYGSVTGKISVAEIVAGKHRFFFWIVVVSTGMVLPVCAAVATLLLGFQMPLIVLWLAIICGLVGDFTMRYLLLKNGYYAPLTPISVMPSSGV